MMQKVKRPLMVLACLCLLNVCVTHAQNQANDDKYSDPAAPVGDAGLTVPKEVVPVMDYWLRDTYVMYGPDDTYYMTGTTVPPERKFPNGQPHCWDYNDGLYLWKSKDLKRWESVGLVWSFDKDAAAWQKAGKPIKPGAKSVNNDPLDSFYRAVWAPELHYIKSKKKWLLVACLNGQAGSFVLESVSGKPEGPYRNIPGSAEKAIFPNIDLGLFEDDNGDVYLVGHNHFIAKMKDDLSDIAEPFRRFKEHPYQPEPYIEGAYISKYNGKYQLLQTVWSVPEPGGSFTYLKDEANARLVHSYDVVVSEADHIYGPYSKRYPAILEGGHNNLFRDRDGHWWSTTFFNPRGEMGKRYKITCRPGLVPVQWVDGKLKPDPQRAAEFYANRNNQ